MNPDKLNPDNMISLADIGNTNVMFKNPVHVAPMPSWPGASTVVNLAIAGAREVPPLAMGHDFADGSSVCVEYQLTRRTSHPKEMYERIGEPPLLAVLVLHRGVGFKDVLGIPMPHGASMAGLAVRELAIFLGPNRRRAELGAGLTAATVKSLVLWSGI